MKTNYFQKTSRWRADFSLLRHDVFMPSSARPVAAALAASAASAALAALAAAGLTTPTAACHHQRRPIQQQRHGGQRDHFRWIRSRTTSLSSPTRRPASRSSRCIASLDAPEPQVLIKVRLCRSGGQQGVGHRCSRQLHRRQQQLFAEVLVTRQFFRRHAASSRSRVQPERELLANNFGLPQSLTGAGRQRRSLSNSSAMISRRRFRPRHRRQGAGVVAARPFSRVTARWRRSSSARAFICPAASV